MAAVSLSPTPPVPFSAMSSAMSSRRVPLSANPNAANSPLRSASTGAAGAFAKQQRRSHASMQREENYGQPPAKKQMLDIPHGISARATAGSLRSPTPSTMATSAPTASTASTAATAATRRVTVQRNTSSRVYQQHQHHQHEIPKVSEKEAEEVRRWQQSQRLRFPKLVFYFDNLPEDQSSRLSKHVTYLGAREDKFFSIDITHVVTTRPIPPEEKPLTKQQQQQQQQQQHKSKESHGDDRAEMAHEHVQTINPSLLSRTHAAEMGLSSTSLPVKRKLFDTASSRRMPLAPFGAGEDAIRKPRPTRSTDILQRARDMGKKIWSLEKLQRVLDMLLEPDPYRSAELGQRMRSGTTASVSSHTAGSRYAAGNQALLQMLDKERHSGPSDRDPTVATRELIYFKGPYIYVYDIEEKQRPIMVREYAKVVDKEEGDWPQLRPNGGTRCPFVEDTDQLEARAEKRRARMRPAREAAAATAATATAAATTANVAAASQQQHKTLASRYAAAATVTSTTSASTAATRQVTGKRTLAEMEDGHNRLHSRQAVSGVRPVEAIFDSKVSSSASTAAVQNVFTSRAKSARCFAGEPVASGLQAAGLTSAIRSQMISSATGTMGARAGTSKEMYGLQRKVLQKSTTASTASQHDLSSHRVTETSMDLQQVQQPQPMQAQHGHSYSRSTSLGRTTAAQLTTKLGMATAVEDTAATVSHDDKHKRTLSAPVAVQAAPRPKRRDPKPGYCENCQDKFDDFEDHILSHKHRKFAEDDRNWTDLDELLSQLKRCPKYGFDD